MKEKKATNNGPVETSAKEAYKQRWQEWRAALYEQATPEVRARIDAYEQASPKEKRRMQDEATIHFLEMAEAAHARK